MNNLLSAFYFELHFVKSSGFPMPYIQDTDETTMTSFRPDNSVEVVESRSFLFRH